MNDIVLALVVVALVSAICAVALLGIKHSPRTADPLQRRRSPFWTSDWDDPGD